MTANPWIEDGKPMILTVHTERLKQYVTWFESAIDKALKSDGFRRFKVARILRGTLRTTKKELLHRKMLGIPGGKYHRPSSQ